MRAALRWTRLSIWHWILLALFLGAFYALWVRIGSGLGAMTNLSDRFPWGLLTGLNLFCGLSLTVGGFALALIIHLFNLSSYRVILRATLLIALLAYLVGMLALLIHMGRPASGWLLATLWNPQSVLFCQVWCVLFYALAVLLAFAPVLLDRVGWRRSLRWLNLLSVPLLLLVLILSLLQQNSVARVFALMGGKLSPLWSTPLLPVFLFLSSLWATLALLLFTSWQVQRTYGVRIPLAVQGSMARLLGGLLALYLVARFLDLDGRGALPLLLTFTAEAGLLGVEFFLLLLPTLFLFRTETRAQPARLYLCSILVLAGFMTNHLNVAISSLEAGQQAHYLPRWTEVVLAYALIALGFLAFRLAARHLPIFSVQGIALPHEPAVAVNKGA